MFRSSCNFFSLTECKYSLFLIALGSASIKITSVGTMHMSWISGNLNELEDPIAGTFVDA